MEPQATGFFEEAPNQKSFMRLESFLVLLFFFLINMVVFAVLARCVIKGTDMPAIGDNFIWFDTVLLAFAFFPKLAQKLIEMKFNIKAE